MKQLLAPFIQLFKSQRSIKAVNLTFFLSGVIYFGILALLGLYFNKYIGLNDIQSGAMVGILTSGITLFMFILGGTAERIGPKKALFLILFFMGLGALFFALAPVFRTKGIWSISHFIAMLGLLSIIIRMGINKPGVYASLNMLTGGKVSAVDYAMLYGVQQFGAFLPAVFSPIIRHTYGMPGVFLFYGILGILGALFITIILNRSTEREVLNKHKCVTQNNNKAKQSFLSSLKDQIKAIPIKDFHFLFLIIAIMPIQTLYAHQWLTLPQYLTRAFTGMVKDYFEVFENINPLLVFLIAPMVALITAKKNTYKMLITGSLLMALPMFLLSAGPSISLLILFLIIRTFGEAIFQPRFYQAITEMAPEGRKGLYISLADLPYMLTKAITASYSGWFLMRYCPENVPIEQLNTETMWTIHGLIAMITPIGLILAYKWMKSYLKN